MKKVLATTTILGTLLAAHTAMAQEKTVLNWALWDAAAATYINPLIETYEAAHPDIDIKFTDLGSADYQQMLQTQLSGKADNIDIVTVKDTPGYAQLIKTNSLLNLSTAYDPAIDPAPFGGLVEELTVDGGYYALPFRADIWVVYYNKDLFDAAEVDYPTNDMTWAEFDDKARALTTGFGANKVYGALHHIWRSTVQLPSILDGEHTLITDDYSFLKPWYERVLALQNDGVIPTYAALKTSGTHYSGPFFNGSVAMLPMGSWFVGTQISKVAGGESLAKNWGIVSFPHPEGVEAGATGATITSLGVNANSSKQDASLDFVKWATGPEGAAIMASVGNLPAMVDDTVTAEIANIEGFPTDENSAKALKARKGYLEMPVSPYAAEVEIVLNRAHDSIMTDNISIDDGIAEMNEEVGKIIK
jgi:multiple sugar transport system substrate-binding protein